MPCELFTSYRIEKRNPALTRERDVGNGLGSDVDPMTGNKGTTEMVGPMTPQQIRSNDEVLRRLPFSIRRAILPPEEYSFLDRVDIVSASAEYIHLRFVAKWELDADEQDLVYDAGAEIIADFPDCKGIREEVVQKQM